MFLRYWAQAREGPLGICSRYHFAVLEGSLFVSLTRRIRRPKSKLGSGISSSPELSVWSLLSVDPRQIPASRRPRPADSHASLPSRGGYFGTLDPPTGREPRGPMAWEHPPTRRHSIRPPRTSPEGLLHSRIQPRLRSSRNPLSALIRASREGPFRFSGILRTRFPKIDVGRRPPRPSPPAPLDSSFPPNSKLRGARPDTTAKARYRTLRDHRLSTQLLPTTPRLDGLQTQVSPRSHRHLRAKHPPRGRREDLALV